MILMILNRNSRIIFVLISFYIAMHHTLIEVCISKTNNNNNNNKGSLTSFVLAYRRRWAWQVTAQGFVQQRLPSENTPYENLLSTWPYILKNTQCKNMQKLHCILNKPCTLVLDFMFGVTQQKNFLCILSSHSVILSFKQLLWLICKYLHIEWYQV